MNFHCYAGQRKNPQKKLALTMKVTSKETFALKGQKCTYASEEQDI